MKRRFLAKCENYTLRVNGHLIKIDNRRGLVTGDESVIEALLKHPRFGNMIFEVQTEEALFEANKAAAADALQQLMTASQREPTQEPTQEPIPVQPLGAVNVEEEQQKLAQEEAEIKAIEDAEKKAAEEAEAEKKAALEKKQASMQKARDAKKKKK